MLRDSWVNIYVMDQTKANNNTKKQIGFEVRAKFETKNTFTANEYGVRADSKRTNIIIPFNKINLDITSIDEIQEKDVIIEVIDMNNIDSTSYYMKESTKFEGRSKKIVFITTKKTRNTDISNESIPTVD